MSNEHDVIEHYNRFHAAVYGSEGALDRKTRHLICLGAALGANCEPCTKYALGVLRELQASNAEIDEAIEVAMTVGPAAPGSWPGRFGLRTRSTRRFKRNHSPGDPNRAKSMRCAGFTTQDQRGQCHPSCGAVGHAVQGESAGSDIGSSGELTLVAQHNSFGKFFPQRTQPRRFQ